MGLVRFLTTAVLFLNKKHNNHDKKRVFFFFFLVNLHGNGRDAGVGGFLGLSSCSSHAEAPPAHTVVQREPQILPFRPLRGGGGGDGVRLGGGLPAGWGQRRGERELRREGPGGEEGKMVALR